MPATTLKFVVETDTEEELTLVVHHAKQLIKDALVTFRIIRGAEDDTECDYVSRNYVAADKDFLDKKAAQVKLRNLVAEKLRQAMSTLEEDEEYY